MPYIIEELFDTIIYSATEMRKRFHSLHAYPDRLEYWKRLQKIFESAIALHTIRLGKFRILDTHIYNSIMKLPEKTINGFGHEQLIEPHHLLIELVKNPSIYRLSNNVMLLLYLAFIYGNYNGLSYSERNTGYKLDLTEDEVNSLGNIQTYPLTDQDFKKSLGLDYADSVQNLRFHTVLHPSTPRCFDTGLQSKPIIKTVRIASNPLCFDTFSRLRDTYIKTLRKYITGKTTLTAMRAEGELREALLGRPQPP